MQKSHIATAQSNESSIDKKLLTNPCSCLGNNEACFKCGGWGFVDSIALNRVPKADEKLTLDRVWRKKKRPKLKSEKNQPKINPAPVVKKNRQYEVTFDFQTGLRKLLGESFVLPKSEAKKNSKLLQGDSSIVIELLYGILSKKPNRDRKSFGKKRATLRDASIAPLHKKKNLAKIETNDVSKAKRPSVFEKHRVDPTSELTSPISVSDNRNAERVLDASRDYYSAYRENGRFGSHSSHDDYGEEADM